MTIHVPHHSQAPSPWVTRWARLIAPGAPVLDVACGSGRHLRWLAAQGHPVTGVDRDGAALAPLTSLGELIEADIENAPWPLPGRRFGAVIVTHYLWRPLMPTLLASVADGGALIYETFATGNETVGKPSRPDFLLRPGELLAACAGPEWRVVAYENGWLGSEQAEADAPGRFVQRIAAMRLTERPGNAPARHPL
jgi:SAM-dependent methyltransferase